VDIDKMHAYRDAIRGEGGALRCHTLPRSRDALHTGPGSLARLPRDRAIRREADRSAPARVTGPMALPLKGGT
jgi:hypothetical protein